MPERRRLRRPEGADDVVDRPARDRGGVECRRARPGRRDRPAVAARIAAQLGAMLDPLAVGREPGIGRQLRQRRGRRRTAATVAPSRPPRRSDRPPCRTSRTGRCSGGRCRGAPEPPRSTNAFWAWLTRLASVAPSSETSIRWPMPGGVAAPARVATQQCRQHADRAEHPGHDVADGHADLGRAATLGVRRAGDRHEAADRLDHEVVAGPSGRRSVAARSPRSRGGRVPD